MKQYLITMVLESDTCFGAGESKNGLVNTEILLDENNFPYFLSKTFMGVWRESIENFILPSLDNQKPEDQKHLAILKSLFSDLETNSDVEACWQSNLSNFTIDKGIADKFNDAKYENEWEKKHKVEEVSPTIKNLLNKTKHDALLKIEQATRINDNQVAEDKSLRAIRVIKKGVVFNSMLTIKGDVQQSDKLFLEKLLKIIKHMGTGKTRGMGRVRLELRDLPASEIKPLTKPSYKNIICYEFEIQEPVKVSKSEEQYDFEPTHKYIPGGTMRGAFLANWLQQDKQKALDYVQKIKYYNAYPIYVEENEEIKYYSIPMPNIYRNDKQQGRTFKAELHQWVHKNSSEMDKRYVYETIFDSYVTDTLYKKSNEPNLIYKYSPAPFCYIDDEKICAFEVKTRQRFHHTHQKSNENIYRYEAIEPGYRYYGFLDLSEIEKQEGNNILKKLLEMPTMWIGGSKKSGYGRVEIKSLDSYDSLEEALKEMNILGDSKKSDAKTDLLYFYSDYAGDLGEIDNLELSSQDMSLSLGKVTGYNTHWNARTPMVEVIEKGSVIRSKQEQTDQANQKLKERAYLTEEGFGSIIKNPKIFTLNIIKAVDKKKHDGRTKSTQYHKTSIKYEGEYDIFLKDRMESFVERKIRGWISLTMEDGSFEKFVRYINRELKDNFRTAANSLIQLIDSQTNDEKVQNSIEQWLKDKKQVSLNREQIQLNYKLLDLNIAGYSLEEWLSGEVLDEEKTQVNNFLELDFSKLYPALEEDLKWLCPNSEIRKAILEQRKIQTRLIFDILYYGIQSYDQMKGEC